MLSYAILLGIALMLNAREPKMLALTVIIGAGIFFPIPEKHFYFYVYCIIGETIIGASACLLNVRASKFIFRTSVLLIIFHFLGYNFNGYLSSSPYQMLRELFGHAELLACIFLSLPIIQKINHGKN